MKLKVGIIGCGMITKVRHAPEYAENPNCEIAAFYDQDKERAKALAGKYGAVCCESAEELLAMDIDLVSVCVANAMHAEYTIKALEAGKHVLCEKPMAVTLEQCEAMEEAALRTGRTLMIGHNQRFALAHQEAHRLIREGKIGRVLSFETKFGHGGPEVWTGTPNTWFFDKKQAQFGAMADLGIHKTDLIHYLIGEPITSVRAILTTLDKRYPDGNLINVDDNAFCLYQTDSGITGIMHVSWTLYGNEKNSIVVYGTEGVVRCYDDDRYTLILERKGEDPVFYDLEPIIKNSDQTIGRRTSTGVIDEFVNSVLENREPLTGARCSIAAMRVIFAAEESAATGRTVHVSQPDGAVSDPVMPQHTDTAAGDAGTAVKFHTKDMVWRGTRHWKFGIQSFNFVPGGDWDRVSTEEEVLKILNRLADAGYDGVEWCNFMLGKPYSDPAAIRRMMDQAGLETASLHFHFRPGDNLEETAAEAVERCRILGTENLVFAFSKPDMFGINPDEEGNFTDDQIDAWAEKINEVTAVLKKAAEGTGIRVMYHNHGDEFRRGSDGAYVMDKIDADAKELDIYWASKGLDGKVATALWYAENRIGDFCMLHVKDGLEGSVHSGEMCGWGKGTFNLQSIINLADAHRNIGWVVIENDAPHNFGRTALEDAVESAAWARDHLKNHPGTARE